MRRKSHTQRSVDERRRDRGVTIVEILIAVVLIGGVVAGTMATLRATVISGTVHRDHSNAHGWLQSASDVLYAADKEYCDTADADQGEATVRADYEAVVDAVPNPQDWQDWQIRIVPPVRFWNAQDLNGDSIVDYYFGGDCDPSLSLQLIQLEVKSTDGKIIETVEIVK